MTTSGQSPLLEREEEVRLLRGAWRTAAAGHGSLWFLCAEAGGGKTRLATELCRATGARVLWGAAEPVSPPEPYQALVHALPGFEPAATRAESVARAVELLEQAGGGGPLLLVLDDLHFADEATAAVVVRLAAVCASRRWLTLAAFRPGEGSAALHAGMTELVAQGQAHRLDLPPLTRAAVGVLVAGVRGAPAAAADVDAIYTDGGGNPWFTQALARGEGAIAAARDRMLLRLDRLENAVPGANAILAAMAPAPRPLPHAVVAELCGGDAPALRRTLAGLRDAGVLHERDGGWRFRHELVRRSLLQAMIIADQQDVHRALAEVLEVRGGTASELAMLFAVAGDGRAVAWAIRAAKEAAAVDAHQEAMAQLERALSLDIEPDVRRTALQAAVLEARSLGRYAESRRLAEEAIAIAGGEPEEVSHLHQRAADAAWFQGDSVAAAAHMDAAEQVLEGRPVSFQMGYLAAGRVLQYAMAVLPEQAAAAAERACEIARRLDSPRATARLEAEARSFLLVSQIDSGDPAGFAILDTLERFAGQPRLAREIAVTFLNAYSGAVIALFQRRAAELYARCAELIRRHELGWMFRAEPYRVLELVQRGRYGDALGHAALVAPPVATPEETVRACAIALCEARAGSIERARATLPPAESLDVFRLRALTSLVRLELATLASSPELGELARRVYAETEPRRYARVAGMAAVSLARAGLGAPPAPAWLAADGPVRVLWDWARGIATDDAPRLREVAARLAALELPYEAALALADAGSRGDAYRALTALGATAARRTVAEQLRAAAEPIPRRTRAAIARDGLTPTEREVCRLVATGARNEAIAERLGVSVRTVESHLGRIYQKAECRGRVALAAWWQEQDGEPDRT